MEQEYTPQHIKDEVIKDLINKLIRDTEFEEQERRFDPYSLDSKKPLRFEAKSDHGVHELKSASKKLEPAYTSMFEVEFLRQVVGVTYPFPATANNADYFRIILPNEKDTSYLKSSLVNQLLKEGNYKRSIRLIENGRQFIATFIVERDFLKENCVRAK
ncbi:hypothetical protein CJD36_016805 [Flavipsychrobacter stenotrophus]|uniref:Uncharacterized protein n=1 Tax=Flavipsychrobacter stenotrophus TaxID=2077091 RepID=A0A2S7SRR0_9BACT|nr:hypothetical protein [Flavipsychrobacter stenotrophus]PQJ09599.1 hypothetical protein CJD36_016805 [Flavipsychrobacter stenotrophus]